MAIKVKVRKGRQIIVPIRFARAKDGDADAAFPEVDDRGFPMGDRPSTWGATTMRGPMVSIAQGDTVKIKVVRLDIDESAPLFVTSKNPQAAAIVGKAGPLTDGIFQVKGVLDTRNMPVKIQVHLGSIGGPVLGELEPHIFQMRQVRVRAHLMTINGVATARTADSLVSVIEDVNKIWRPVGIEFLYKPSETMNDSISGLAVAGQVTTDPEIDKILAVNPVDDVVNLYLVAESKVGVGVTVVKPSTPPHGALVRDSGEPHAFAHELGHFLSLAHSSDDANQDHFRDDIWSERQLMYFGMNLVTIPIIMPPLTLNEDPQPEYRHDVGYGRGKPGNLIPVKDLQGEPFDGCVAASRRRALDPF